MSKIIDFERKGNVVRFYLGADDCTDYWGDDWNDAPYDCNAETVYDRFVIGVKDIAFPFDSLVLEPSSEWEGYKRYVSKEDMKNRHIPCIIIVPKELHNDTWCNTFTDWLGAEGIKKIYFGDPEELLNDD